MKNVSYSTEEFNDITSSGWLLAMLMFANDIEFFTPFKDLEINMKQVRYSHLDKIKTLIASVLTGCKYTSDINDVLVPDTVSASMLGMERYPDQSQINRYLTRFSDSNIELLRSIHTKLFVNNSPSLSSVSDIIVDLDQSGLSANGRKFELADKGYFPRRRGEKGYQMSAAYVGQTGEVVTSYLDPGNVHCSNRTDDLLKAVTTIYHEYIDQRKLIIRADSGYGSADNIQKFIDAGVKFVVKGFSTRQSHKLALKVHPDDWVDVGRFVRVSQLSPTENSKLRIIVCEVVSPKSGERSYSHLITNIMTMSPVELFEFYNQRQTIEAFIKTCKNVYGLKNLRTGVFNGIYAFLWITLMTHNLIVWAKQTVFARHELGKMGIRTLIEKVSRIPAKISWRNGVMEVIMSSISKFAKLLVNALNPKPYQLELPFMSCYA